MNSFYDPGATQFVESVFAEAESQEYMITEPDDQVYELAEQDNPR